MELSRSVVQGVVSSRLGVRRATDGGTLADLPALGVRRLRFASWLALAVLVFSLVIAWFRQPNVGVRLGASRPQELLYISIPIAVAVLVALYSERLSIARKLDLGLAYLVYICLFANLYRHWLPYADSDVVRGISPGAVAMLFFAVVVPVPPRRMAITATVAALTDLVALAFTVFAVGQASPPWNLWLWLLVPNAFVALASVLTSRFVYELGESVRRAREMGAYELVERLGSGGMGEVWRADHRTLARPAAIKLIRPELVGASDSTETKRVLARFELEAKATAALTSPHTIAVYDFGRAEDGAFYYVMELLEGMDLESLVLAHGPMPPARAVHLLTQICHSLREAHEAGVVHRDIKPANVFLSRQGLEHDFVKVLDFGLVKIESADSPSDARLTDIGSVMGTPAYMAPEIASGLEATPQSDIYALGCLAYWLLTGRLVFEDDLHPFQQILAHTQTKPEPVSAHVDVPAELDQLVLDCLEKDSGARPPDIKSLHARLLEIDVGQAWTPADAEGWWSTVADEKHELGMCPTLPAG